MGDRGLEGENHHYFEKAESADYWSTGVQGPMWAAAALLWLVTFNAIYSYRSAVCGNVIQRKTELSLLEGEGVVVLAGLAVSHQVAGLLAQPEQRLCICPADRSMVPAADNGRKHG